jgi:hypothetical protein
MSFDRLELSICNFLNEVQAYPSLVSMDATDAETLVSFIRLISVRRNQSYFLNIRT